MWLKTKLPCALLLHVVKTQTIKSFKLKCLCSTLVFKDIMNATQCQCERFVIVTSLLSVNGVTFLSKSVRFRSKEF